MKDEHRIHLTLEENSTINRIFYDEGYKKAHKGWSRPPLEAISIYIKQQNELI